MFGNTEMGRHYDKTRPEGGKERVSTHASEGAESDKDMKDVVAEHGPAERMEMHSHHPDGHVHKATHHDHESASKHVDEAFGKESEPEDMDGEHEEPDGDEAAMPSIPGLRG